MSQPPEDKKPDLSNIPRGAIGLKGVPVNRNARLPSIRSPRDLTLGTPSSKRTFVPNIPVRREKKASEPNKDLSSQGNTSNQSKRTIPNIPERGRGRGRNKPQIIQTEGAVFGEGVSISSNRGRSRESAQKSSHYSGGGGRGSSAYKIEKLQKTKSDISIDINLMRDDFIDDGEEEFTGIKPVVFPLEVKNKEDKLEVKKEICDSKEPFSNQNFAKEMGFDVQKIAKFIKKEKDDSAKSLELPANLPKNEITDVLTSEKPHLVLFQFPKCITAAPLPTDNHQKGQSSTESTSNEQKTSLSSLPEGQLGKLQIMKSGRVRLKVGELYFNLDNTTKLTSRHEVASIQTDGTTADISILGNVLQSFSFVPDVDSLLKK